MKYIINYTDKETAFSVAKELIDTTTKVVSVDLPNIEEKFLEVINDLVNKIVTQTLTTLFKNAKDYSIEIDLTETIASCYETVTKIIKNEANEANEK